MTPLVVRYSRRDVLKIATSSAIVTLVSAFSVGCDVGGVSLETVAKRKIEVLNYPKKARDIGATFIKQRPHLQGHTFEYFTEQLLTSLDLDLEDISPEMLDSLDVKLSEQVRRDFEDENVVIIRGWMLSKTELMLCSLAATINKS